MGSATEEDVESHGNTESEDETDGEARVLTSQMTQVPFEVLQRLKSDGRGPTGQAARDVARQVQELSFKRENKGRPQELTSRRPVGRFREVVQLPKRADGRDPRFDETCGELDKDRFRKQYDFLYKEQLPEERRKLRVAVKRERNEDVRGQLLSDLNRVESYLHEGQQAEKRAKLVSQFKVKEKAAVQEGKKPYFLKKSALRKAELVEKYKELKASGQLSKFLEKRRKRNASKDHKLLPSSRR